MALKVLHLPAIGSAELLARFQREAVVTTQLDDPGICRIHEARVDGGLPYIAMELIEGPSLAEIIARETERNGDSEVISLDAAAFCEAPGPDPYHRVAGMIESVARSLQVAHDAGVAHRDMKPAHIQFRSDGSPVVMDFGLASDDESQVKLTRTGQVFGTPAYMAPEQLTGQVIRPDHRVDVWALGACLYEALTLRPPFAAPTRESLCQSILHKEPEDPRRLNRDLSRDLATIVLTALEKDRDRRYQTARDLAADLQRFRQRAPILARAPSPWYRLRRWASRNPALAASLSVTILSLALGLAFSLSWARDASRARREAEIAEVGSLMQSAQGHFRLGQWPSALRAYDRVETLDPADRLAVTIGKIRVHAAAMNSAQTRRGLECLRGMSITEDQQPQVTLLLNDLFVDRMRSPEDGVEELEALLGPDSPLGTADQAYVNALIAERIPDTQRWLSEALAIDPSHRRANELRATYDCLFGSQERLVATVERFRALYPHDPRTKWIAACAAARSGRIEVARSLLASIADRLPPRQLRLTEVFLEALGLVMNPEKVERVLMSEASSVETLMLGRRLIAVISEAPSDGASSAAHPSSTPMIIPVSCPRSVALFMRQSVAALRKSSVSDLRLILNLPAVRSWLGEQADLDLEELIDRDPDNALLNILDGLIAVRTDPERAEQRFSHCARLLRGSEWERLALNLLNYGQTELIRKLSDDEIATRASAAKRWRQSMEGLTRLSLTPTWILRDLGHRSILVHDFDATAAILHHLRARDLDSPDALEIEARRCIHFDDWPGVVSRCDDLLHREGLPGPMRRRVTRLKRDAEKKMDK